MPTGERALLHRGGRPGTWGSLGLWSGGAGDYAQACEALATAVWVAAGADANSVPGRDAGDGDGDGAGERVLSVACGAGDELLLWTGRFSAASVLGVEHDDRLVQAARRLTAAQAARIEVRHGSGSDLLALGLAAQCFDRVLCVDAAYHLRPRPHFLQAAWSLLRPGGRLAYTDLCLEPARAPGRVLGLRGAAWLCGLSSQDLLPAAAQAARLQQLGFIDVRSQRLDGPVLDGFAAYVRAQGRRVACPAWHPDWRRPALTARLIGPCRAAGLGYVLLSAAKPGDGAAPRPAARAA